MEIEKGKNSMNYQYCHGMTHVIKEGDTLYHISRRYQVPLALLLRANPYVDVYNLQIGDEICIPFDWTQGQNGNNPAMPGGPLPLPTPEVPEQPAMPGGPLPLPTPEVPEQPAMPGGPLPLPTPEVPGPEGTVTRPCPNCVQIVSYVVKDKDSLQNILDFFQITLDELLEYNNLNQLLLEPGMLLKIPKGAED